MAINNSLITLNDPHSVVSESYRICRTNINFMKIDQNYQVLMLTSSVPAEGKTTTSCNLAITMAQANKKVLLIDGDMRKSSVYKLFDIPSMPGLTDVVYEKRPLSEVVQHIANVPDLDILAVGRETPDPTKLLASNSFKNLLNDARNIYDLIIIDTPPVLSVSDTAIISQLVDGVLLIVAMKKTSKSLVKDAKKALEKVNANIIGVVLTKADSKYNNYYYGNYNK